MKPLRSRLEDPGVLLGDGAMGTMLIERGLRAGECPEKINLEKPGQLEEIALLYLNAGAEIIGTNTFGGSPLKLGQYGLEGKFEEINRRGCEIVRKTVGNRAWVSASCGPSGKILEPYGDTKRETVFDSFRRQMDVLVSSGADMICIETMTDLGEAVIAVEAARSVSATIPVCATMTFDSTPRGFYTIMGTTIEQAAKGLTAAGADIIGSNCGNGIQNMIAIAAEFRKLTVLPVIIQSNAGIPALVGGALTYPETPGYMAEKSQELLTIGVKIIGGCCGTTPAHIAAIKRRVDRYNRQT